MKIEITSVSARDGGALICLAVLLSEGEKVDERELLLLSSQYTELGVSRGEIDEATFDEISEASELCLAVRRGMSILGYGASSKKELAKKLVLRGVAREMANGAAEMLERMGYVDENEDAARLAERSLKKYWGIRRISSELMSKGYGDSAVRYALDTLRDVDFSMLCKEYIDKKYRALPDTPDGRKKLFSALMRMGYTSSEIREAFRAFGDRD